MYIWVILCYNTSKIKEKFKIGLKMGRILDMLQEKKKGYHPLVSILELTDECQSDDHRLKLDCHKTIAKYVEAERKSVDIKSEDGSELIKLVINVDGEDD